MSEHVTSNERAVSHLSPPTEFESGRYGWTDLFWATGDMPYNQAMAWCEHHRARAEHFDRMLQVRATAEPEESPSSVGCGVCLKYPCECCVDEPLVAPDERGQFEKWARYSGMNLEENSLGTYYDNLTHWAWQAWYRRASQPQPAAPVAWRYFIEHPHETCWVFSETGPNDPDPAKSRWEPLYTRPAPPPSDGWISITARLPADGEDVLYAFNGKTFRGRYLGCNNEDSLPTFAGNAGWLTGDVEFWQPTPKAPESTRLTKGVGHGE